jgi:hypothetical protein
LGVGQIPSASTGETGPYVLLPATWLKPWAKPNGPATASTAVSATSTATPASVAHRCRLRKSASARGASARPSSGTVRLHRAAIATGQASPAKL